MLSTALIHSKFGQDWSSPFPALGNHILQQVTEIPRLCPPSSQRAVGCTQSLQAPGGLTMLKVTTAVIKRNPPGESSLASCRDSPLGPGDHTDLVPKYNSTKSQHLQPHSIPSLFSAFSPPEAELLLELRTHPAVTCSRPCCSLCSHHNQIQKLHKKRKKRKNEDSNSYTQHMAQPPLLCCSKIHSH